MKGKMTEDFLPEFGLCFAALLVFSAVSLKFSVQAAVVQFVICGVLLAVYLKSREKRARETSRFVEKVFDGINEASKGFIMDFPMPVVVADANEGRILWNNERFEGMLPPGQDVTERRVWDLLEGFNARWLMEGKNASAETVQLNGRYYSVFGHTAKSESGRKGALMVLYFQDITELTELRREKSDMATVISIVSIDNYEELLKNATDAEKSDMLADIDRRLSQWTASNNGVLRKYDRDKYFFIFEERDLKSLVDDKFAVLDAVREIQNVEGVHATLSIGIGKDGDSLKEKYAYASLALEMALSRGGDQVVIKNKFTFDFFGGISKEFEKRTKVKSRVMANALNKLISDSSQVYIMGHKNADIDCVGAAIGMACAVRIQGKPVNIVIDREHSLAEVLFRKVSDLEEYAEMFISPEDAVIQADIDTLLIVVDTNRPDIVESESLLESVNKLAVIDHHRRAASYIENATVNLLEPYASSASELVTELLQYMVPNKTITSREAECLLAGIFLDTKGFTIKTGVKTFEASAYLKRAGADMTEVKKMFQSTFEGYMIRQNIIKEAKSLEHGVVLAVTDKETGRDIAAQAADELLGIIGVSASIVAFKNQEDMVVSARSMGDVNVQVIMEKLGGGGNVTSAGARLSGYLPAQTVYDMIVKAIDDYFEDVKQKEQ